MSLREDRRGQAVQVGAVLLFAVLVVAFSTYQAVVVPAENRRVEFNHNQEVQDDLAELRGAVLGTADATSTRSVTVALGTTYPTRTLGLNPTPPGGSLRTVGTTDPLVNLTIDNAVAVDGGETADFWNGTARAYDTGAVRYSPTYSRYDEAPETVYEHSVLYNRFPSTNTLVLANQTMLDGDRLSIVTIDGSLDRTSSRSASVDVRPESNAGEAVLVEAAGDEPIRLNFSSQLSADRWQRILSDQSGVTVRPGDFATPGDFEAIRVDLDPDREYRLRMTEAAVGQGATPAGPAYLTDVAGDDTTVQPDGSQRVTLQVRDRYNNPVSGVTVNGSVGTGSAGSLNASTATADADGEVTFRYEAPGATETGTQQLNFTTLPESVHGSTFDHRTPENVTMQVTVSESSGGAGGGEGAYDVAWTNPSSEDANDGYEFGSCGKAACTWDVGDSPGDGLSLNASLDPSFQGVGLEFALDDPSVASLSPGGGTTGSDGAARTTLRARSNGTVDVLASANAGTDTISITVENVDTDAGDTQPPSFGTASAQAQSSDDNNNDAESVAFTAEVTDDDAVDRVELTVANSQGTVVGQRTLDPPFYYEHVYLDPDANMQGNGNYVTVGLTAFDVNGNSRTCTGQIDDTYGTASIDSGLDCSTTTP